MVDYKWNVHYMENYTSCNVDFTFGRHVSEFLNTYIWTVDVETYGKTKGRMFSKQGKIGGNIMVILIVLQLSISNVKIKKNKK